QRPKAPCKRSNRQTDRSNRQVDTELRSLPGFTRHTDLPAMLLDDLLHDRQSQTRPAFLRRVKRLEDSLARRLVHSLAFVGNLDPRVISTTQTVAIAINSQQLSRDAHRRILLARIDRVRNHV